MTIGCCRIIFQLFYLVVHEGTQECFWYCWRLYANNINNYYNNIKNRNKNNNNKEQTTTDAATMT